MTAGADTWHRAMLGIQCLASDPGGLGGMVIRARSGPVRDAMIASLSTVPLPLRKIHPTIGDEQLFGGIDIPATLAGGRVVSTHGVLQEPAALILTMAERCGPDLTARLAQHLDRQSGTCLILLDEGANTDEAAPEALCERLAFHVSLDDVTPRDIGPVDVPQDMAVEPASDLDDAGAALVGLAARFGIDSLRAPLLALRCARALASLNGRSQVAEDDIATAAALVYPARATRVPADPPETGDAPPPQPESSEQPDEDTVSPEGRIDGDMLVDAVRAMLPPGLLDSLIAAQSTRRASSGGGAGTKIKGNRRGRPLPSRPGRMDGRARIDLVATLRAAAPWQPLRRQARPDAPGLLIRSSDIRLRRFEEKSDRLLIFTVDASGSAAVSRLNEAKGAVELLLGEAYARRDQVALIGFRGNQAELLLPPTRSLVQTKRRLAGLPGGGGTPLAAGLRQAGDLASLSRTKGLSPTIVVMTDGRANIALDGGADRTRASNDADIVARLLRSQGLAGLIIDMSNRPQPALRSLAATFGAPYLALPRADAHRVSAAVNDALTTG